MLAVGLENLQSQLGEYVRLAANGETVLVTDRDRVVAELVPPSPDRSPLLADVLLADAVRKGWITPPLRPATEAVATSPVAPWAQIEAELEEDREDRGKTAARDSPKNCRRGKPRPVIRRKTVVAENRGP